MSDKTKNVIDFIEEHCSVIGTPRKEELKKMVKDHIGDLEDKIRDLKSDLEDEQHANSTANNNVGFKLEGVHANLRNEMVIDLLQENFANIPIDELENFIKQYKK